MGNAAVQSVPPPPETAPSPAVSVFSISEADTTARVEGTWQQCARQMAVKERGLCEIVFGSVPLAATGGRRAFKAHWFRGVLCLSFLSGRSSALCVAFVFADQSSDVLHSSDAYIDTVLALWPLLRSSSSSLAALTAAAARVASLCPLRFVPPPMLPLPLPAPSVAAARAVDTLMLDLPASAKASDCLLAFLVASPPARNLGSVNFPRCLPLFVGAPPPPLPPSRWAVRATHCAGNQRAVAEMQRALALRVEALLAWQADWLATPSACAADVAVFINEVMGLPPSDAALVARLAQHSALASRDFADALTVALDLLRVPES